MIEMRWFPDEHLSIEGYVKGLKLDMLEQNDDVIREFKKEPVFQIERQTKNITRN